MSRPITICAEKRSHGVRASRSTHCTAKIDRLIWGVVGVLFGTVALLATQLMGG